MNDISQYLILKEEGIITTAGVIEYRGTDIIGVGIRARTGYGVNHSELVIVMQSPYTGVKRYYTHASLAAGPVPVYLSDRLAKYNGTAYYYPLKAEYQEFIPQIEAKAFEYLGVGYDYPAIAKLLFGRTHIDLNLLFCSEFCQASCWMVNDTIRNGGIAFVPGELTKKGGLWITEGGAYQLMIPPPDPPMRYVRTEA